MTVLGLGKMRFSVATPIVVAKNVECASYRYLAGVILLLGKTGIILTDTLSAHTVDM